MASDPTQGLPGLMIKNIPKTAKSEEVLALFKQFGEIVPNQLRIRKGVAVINFVNPANCEKAAAATNLQLNGETLALSVKPPRAPRPPKENKESNGTNGAADSASRKVYIAKIPKELNRDDIKKIFSQFGEVEATQVRFRSDDQAFAFVTFKDEAAGKDAVAQSGKLMINGEPATVEFRKARAAPKKAAAAASKKKKAPKGKESSGENGNKKQSQQKKPVAAQSEDSKGKSVYVKSLPFNVTSDDLKATFSNFGSISRAEVRVVATSVFIDYNSKEDLEKAVTQATETEKNEKKGSFGSAILKASRSRSKKHEDSHAMYVAGFGNEQLPTEADIRNLFGGSSIKQVTILPGRAYAFVDFVDAEAANQALAAATREGIFLQGSSTALELEASKATKPPRSNRRKKRTSGKDNNNKESAAAN